MEKRSGLGKGLEALFGTSNSGKKEEEAREGEIIREINLIEIEPNREQARKNFDKEQLEELANSIKSHGVIQPIIVAKKEDYYQIIAGERRWRAAKLAGLKTIPTIVRADDEQRNKEISLIENIQREDLNPLEKAIGIKQLMNDHGLTQQQVADILGKSRSSIANTVRLLNLDDRVKGLVLAGKLTEGHGKALLSYEDGDKQYEMALAVIEIDGTVRDAERKVKNNHIAEKKRDKKYEAIFKEIENNFQSFFGTKVKLNAGQKSGKIVIQYSSNEELERILDLIK